MKKSLKGAITAGAVGIILAGGLASPASAAAGIDSNFYVTGPGPGQHPRHEIMTKCGTGKLVRHYKSAHTHWRIAGDRTYAAR